MPNLFILVICSAADSWFLEVSNFLKCSSTLLRDFLVTLLGVLAKPTTKQWGNFLSFEFS